MTTHRKEHLPYIIQEPSILRCPTARIATETRYFSPPLETVEILDGAVEGTICIAESNRRGFQAGMSVRAIIILDPLAWKFMPGETDTPSTKIRSRVGW
ncbi:MAG: hypothetical protein QM706_07790 [Nitrospira sp.]